jgi:hypothetical protein
MLWFSILYSDLIKKIYIADTSEREDRGWKQPQRQGEDGVTFWITLLDTDVEHKMYFAYVALLYTKSHSQKNWGPTLRTFGLLLACVQPHINNKC